MNSMKIFFEVENSVCLRLLYRLFSILAPYIFCNFMSYYRHFLRDNNIPVEIIVAIFVPNLILL